jgi:two-component system sensor histidine kinase ChvG
VLAAERHRRNTGQGQLVEMALKDVALSVLGSLGIIGEVQINNVDRPKYGNALYGAYGQDFATSDGRRVMIVALTNRQWDGLRAATGMQEALDALGLRMGLVLSREGDRFKARHEITALLAPWFRARRVEDFAAQKRLLGIIGNDVLRMDRLIGDISDSSRVDAELSRTVAEPVDVQPILAVLAELHNTTRNEGDPLMETEIPDSPLVALGVEDRLVQVFRNLIGNAISFSPRDGHVWLRARSAGGDIEVVVEDEGPGIPDAKLEGIFDRFYSERPRGERFGQHSGLGLSISKQIVEGLRGKISAENRRDAEGRVLGARFVMRVPRA